METGWRSFGHTPAQAALPARVWQGAWSDGHLLLGLNTTRAVVHDAHALR